ncbi:MAG: phenylalanine--tRNA ligase subunit beta, partial [Steroidobacteraceae bacterium]
MKLPLAWLREWVDWPRQWDAQELARRLTMAGFEIEAISPAAPAFSDVVVARILDVQPHPQAERLRVCRVRAGSDTETGELQIVCGAANVRSGLITALARVGASLPDGKVIGAAQLRGVASNGMLCSARELGLSEGGDGARTEGIIELPADAPPGMPLRQYLQLDDMVLEVNVTPNRGDAMSVLGIAREVAALSGAAVKAPDAGTGDAQPAGADAVRGNLVASGAGAAEPIRVRLQPRAGAARLASCVLRGIDNGAATPWWLRERLRRCGVRSISPVVDVTNYVMLELGQPMHAYDLAKLRGAALSARRARSGERVRLLDGREIDLTDDVLVIADGAAPLGLAGVMGGERSAIGRDTRDVVLEVAWFAPAAIAGRARRYGLTTDASQRFERGVDWRGQERALARAIALIERIAGGTTAAVAVVERTRELPRTPAVGLRHQRLQQLLGTEVAAPEVERRLLALGMTVRPSRAGWQVQPPSWRFDIAIEADLIEEVARLGGLDSIEERAAPMPLVPRAPAAHEVDQRTVMRTLAARGYQEVITFAFVDPVLQQQLFGPQPAIELANPIAAELAVMRSSLWPGLIGAARENLRRQQQRVRLFEIGNRFSVAGDAYLEQKTLAGIALGTRLPEQWGSEAVPLDFYDVKGDVESLLVLAGAIDPEGATAAAPLSFTPAELGCLHPGRSAEIRRGGQVIGVIGELHPRLVRELDLTYTPMLFELQYAAAFHAQLAQFREVSRFPRIRRDISVTVPEQTAFASVRERVSVAASSLLKELRVFDIYEGTGVETGRKSLALGLILQDLSRT